MIWISFCCKSISSIYAIQELLILNFPWMNYKNLLLFFVFFPTIVFGESQKKTNLVFNKPGENVAFTCPYKIGESVLQVMWERIKADWVDVVVLCSSTGKQSFGSDFKEHTLVDCSDQANSKIHPKHYSLWLCNLPLCSCWEKQNPCDDFYCGW